MSSVEEKEKNIGKKEEETISLSLAKYTHVKEELELAKKKYAEYDEKISSMKSQELLNLEKQSLSYGLGKDQIDNINRTLSSVRDFFAKAVNDPSDTGGQKVIQYLYYKSKHLPEAGKEKLYEDFIVQLLGRIKNCTSSFGMVTQQLNSLSKSWDMNAKNLKFAVERERKEASS